MAVYRGVPWKFVFTDLGSVTTTWAEGLMTNRNIALTLDQPSVFTAAVWPDDKRVNTLFQADGYPLVAQSNRLIYGFRREAPPPIDDTPQPPWVCRFGGILMSPEDEADQDIPLTHITAYDPWKYLEARPCTGPDGVPPGPQGINLFAGATSGEQYVLTFLLNTILNNPAVGGIGNGVYIDAGDGSRIGEGPQYADWGGTPYYQGTIQTAPDISQIVYSAQQGATVADVWNDLCNSGNLDIVLTPIYDPIFRPGYTHELNIYGVAGEDRNDAIFDWDVIRRNLKKIDRMHDGTPPNFFNTATFFQSQGGIAVPALAPYNEPASTATYGAYWANQSFPSFTSTDPSGQIILALIEQAGIMSKQGKRTLTIDPIPERSPVPLLDYICGDRVPVYATKRLRVTIAGLQRVQAIPIAIDDNGIEMITSLLLSPDFRTVSQPPI